MYNTVKFQGKDIVSNKVVCIGRNYVEHIKELQNEMPSQQVIFFKPNSSIGEELVAYENSHYEGELSFLVKDNTFVAVSFGLDLTKRDVQSFLKNKGLPWERAKAFRGSALFSEFVPFGDINELTLKLYLNDKLVQDGGVKLMIHKPDEVLKEVSSFCDLQEYDILMSGTPKGVGQYKSGDKLTGCIYEKDVLLTKSEWIAK